MFNLIIDKDSREFWDGAKKNKLMIQKCKSSGLCFLYSRGHTGVSAANEYEWVEASGNGTIYSYTVSYIPGGSKYYLDKTPYIIGSILLEEGVRLTSNIISKNFENIQIGKKVKVEYVKLNEELVFPCFKLV
ncbi:Zn-ribbon domain-containing OB-fold protein [Alphaproteobacteria bacterium]|nr:Zn-ribbon domain-containing OB-fold protein [Alphaproteobacteria bacterium]